MFFSWFELGSIVLLARPVQTSCFVPGSYMSRTRVPTAIVELVHDAWPLPRLVCPRHPIVFPHRWRSGNIHHERNIARTLCKTLITTSSSHCFLRRSSRVLPCSRLRAVLPRPVTHSPSRQESDIRNKRNWTKERTDDFVVRVYAFRRCIDLQVVPQRRRWPVPARRAPVICGARILLETRRREQ
jgi:hypothetical protein